MHQIIYALVEAPTREEALTRGSTTFDRLVGVHPEDAAVFDYYVTFDDDRSSVAGKARWGELPVVAPVDSQTGAALLERVRVGVEEFSTDELMHDKELVRHACHNLGAYRGPSLFLYTEFGTAIRHREQLDRVLESDDQLWVIPADVHY